MPQFSTLLPMVQALSFYDATQNFAWQTDLRFRLWVADGTLCGAVRESDATDAIVSNAANIVAFEHGIIGLLTLVFVLPITLLHTASGKKRDKARHQLIVEAMNGDYMLRDRSNFRLETQDIRLALFSETPALFPATIPTPKMQLHLDNDETRHFTLVNRAETKQLSSALSECGIFTRWDSEDVD